MDVEVKTALIGRALGPIMRATSARSSMVITQCIRVSAVKGALELEATNLEQIARVHVECDVAKQGEIIVDAKTFSSAIKKAPGDTIRIAIEKGSAKVTSAKTRTTLPLIADSSDWPPGPSAPKGAKWSTIPAATLSHLLASSYAASEDTTRANICVVHLECDGGMMRGVSTDGHRMVVHESPVDDSSFAADVPIQSVPLLLELCSGNQDIRCVVDGAYLHVASGDTTVALKLGDSKFPPWKKIVEMCKDRTVARLVRTLSLNAADRVASVLDKNNHIAIKVGDGVIAMSGEDNRGRVDDEIVADVTGPDVVVGVGPLLLREAISSMRGDEIELAFGDGLDPIVVRDIDGQRLNITMPMRM